MKSAVSPIPKPYPNSLAVAEVTRRRPTALSTWPFVTPQTLRRSEGCKHRPRLCDEAKSGRADKGRERHKSRAGGRLRVEGIRRPVAAYNILGALSREPEVRCGTNSVAAPDGGSKYFQTTSVVNSSVPAILPGAFLRRTKGPQVIRPALRPCAWPQSCARAARETRRCRSRRKRAGA
jgi:hypothetical protein